MIYILQIVYFEFYSDLILNHDKSFTVWQVLPLIFVNIKCLVHFSSLMSLETVEVDRD